jgi:hypothetical protein
MDKPFLVAAVVVAVFALIAALETSGSCLGETYAVWVGCVLLAYVFHCLVGEWVAAKINAERRRPAQPTQP